MSRPSTFSVVAADLATGEVGVAVQSKFLAVGAMVAFARGDVGAVATQAFACVPFGPRGLDLLAKGLEPAAALERLLADDERREERQVGLVDLRGRAASHTGLGCFEHASSLTGAGFACQGNILASADVVPAMARAFERAAGLSLPERLVEVLRAGQAAGGDQRGQESAALLVAKTGGGYGGDHDRYVDLRVDHHDRPIQELGRLLELHRFYFQRPREEELVAVDAALEREIGALLARLGKRPPGQDLWDALYDHLAWENLEERWGGRGRIDLRVLEHLRRGRPDDEA
ncbi:MAG TPA: DUF1028 domain-containing protein [Actinomycetes bacterium]|jgi:uncharacterized Ntn-hydrolase superfamily protein|nr:DUF1028 domain-containing protein [Actinomycetes bacterium]